MVASKPKLAERIIKGGYTMRKYTQRELKNLVSIGSAVCLNSWSFDDLNQLHHTKSLDKIGYSTGVYGINGALLQDRETGDLYAITARNTALFQMI